MTKESDERRGSAGRMVIGAFLLGLGGMLLADNLGYDVPGEVWSYWPFLLLGLGAVKMLWPGDRDERSGGFWILVAGLYCWIGSWQLFGLDWHNAWPIFLVAGGMTMVFEGLGRGRSRRERVADET
jgi:hypothetical protein